MTSPQLYLITPPRLPDVNAFADSLEAVFAASAGTAAEAACLQLRLKEVSDDDVLRAAERIAPLCAAAGVGFLINDRADLAAKASADGVHLGQGDGSVAEARRVLGQDADIGVTCHASLHLAMEAGEAGADYVAFGAFFETATKSVTHHAEPSLLTRWSAMATVPSVAIGGITAQTAPDLIAAGADYIAVSSAVWAHTDGAEAGIRAFISTLG